MTEGPKDILRRLIEKRLDSTDGREAWVVLLKGARYLYFISLMGLAFGVVWYFISGEFLDPSRTVGSGVWQQNPAWNTFSGIITAAVFAGLSYVAWKVVLPWQQRKLQEEKKKIEEECEILEKSFLEEGKGVA